MELKCPFHIIFFFLGLFNDCCAESQFSHTVTIDKEKEGIKNNGNDDFKPVRFEDLFKSIKQDGLLFIHGDRKDDVSEEASTDYPLTSRELNDLNNNGLSLYDRTGIHFQKVLPNPYNANTEINHTGAAIFETKYLTRTKRTRMGVPCAWCDITPRPGKHNDQSSTVLLN